MSTPFMIGHCACCGGKTQVKDVRGRPISGLPGTRLCWLCLCDESGKVVTRIGTITLCSNCDPVATDCEEIKRSLVANPASGVTGNEIEWSILPKRKIEVIKVYEEET